ncbi:hypothetical protein ElyMa_005881100 [Elysia marginata]|uniref:Uncharacterized protein n=1 Tax=Elysia marginata TaxID=1093978 RepID=A0AAV4G4S2_9GAST|nr:hypothetical protein ElyMa_005881100 [Elysia marginata]
MSGVVNIAVPNEVDGHWPFVSGGRPGRVTGQLMAGEGQRTKKNGWPFRTTVTAPDLSAASQWDIGPPTRRGAFQGRWQPQTCQLRVSEISGPPLDVEHPSSVDSSSRSVGCESVRYRAMRQL